MPCQLPYQHQLFAYNIVLLPIVTKGVNSNFQPRRVSMRRVFLYHYISFFSGYGSVHYTVRATPVRTRAFVTSVTPSAYNTLNREVVDNT